VVSAARERGEEAVVVTFWPHPRTVLQQDARDFRLLSSLEEKKALLTACGISRVDVIPFTKEFAAMKADEYLQLLHNRYGASLVVMGYDNRIGSDGLTCAQLSEEGYSSQTVGSADPSRQFALRAHSGPSLLCCRGWHRFERNTPLSDPAPTGCSDERDYPAPTCHSERSEESHISSTAIRKALTAGEVERANEMLGYRYNLYGVVVAGNRMGRTIGFPTANMQLYEPLKLVPADGVYAVDVEVQGRYFKGMCNIGMRPTVDGKARTIETHILDFNEDIYGLPLRIHFVRRIRDERKFPSLEALREQLQLDALNCKK